MDTQRAKKELINKLKNMFLTSLFTIEMDTVIEITFYLIFCLWYINNIFLS